MSQAGKKSEFASAGTVEVKLTDLSGAIEAVQDSANGKNKITWSLRAPTEDDLGTIGDTWWVNEARTHEDGTAYLATIAQYQYQASGWIQVEMAHEVIASVDLGTATVGELDGIRIMAKTIGAEQLRADFADFVVARSGTYIAGDNRSIMDDSGYTIFNDDGEVRTKLSPDDSVFKGEVEADTLVVNGGSELRSTENRIAQGAKMTLESGVTDPTAPPTVQTFWDTDDVSLGTINDVAMDSVGLAWDGTYYWTAHRNSRPPTNANNRIFAYRVDPTTGVGEFVGGRIPDGKPWASEIFGVTCFGSELFWLGRSLYAGTVWITDLSGDYLRHFSYSDLGYSDTNPLGYRPCIGASFTRIYIAQCDDAGQLIWRTYNTATGALLGTVNTGYPTSSDLLGVYVGAADWGVGDRVALVKKSTRQVIVLTTAGANEASLHWNTPNAATGIVYRDGQFRTLDPNGAITNYEGSGMGDNTSDWWATYRWSIDEDDNGINDYVSRIGPVKRFYWDRRSRVRFMGAPLPVGTGYITPSIAKKTTTPARTDFRTPAFSVWVGESTAWISTLPSDWQTGPAPGDANTFPKGTPSSLVSASSTFEVKGDGSGRWGPLTFPGDGTVIGVPRVATGGGVSFPNVDPNGGSQTITVNFPAGRFTAPPSVSALTSHGRLIVVVFGITKDSFSFRVFNNFTSSANNAVGTWQAIQET